MGELAHRSILTEGAFGIHNPRRQEQPWRTTTRRLAGAHANPQTPDEIILVALAEVSSATSE
jgi:hypothetical protein